MGLRGTPGLGGQRGSEATVTRWQVLLASCPRFLCLPYTKTRGFRVWFAWMLGLRPG